jgi:cyclopropane-fatty-acyl-phospholipid synthase
MMMLLENRFAQVIDRIRAGTPIPLRFQLWNGHRFELASNAQVTITIPTPQALRYFLPPDLNKLGEAFVEGHIRVDGPIDEVFRVTVSLARAVGAGTRAGFHFLKRHTRIADRKAIEYHYDVSDDFYSLFLDRGMVYSCAYFRDENDSLEAAQMQKLDHILNKLMLKPGERLLDIGCGWGSLVLRAAQKYGAIAHGITLSKNQHALATQRIREAGLQDRCTVELRDYRDIEGEGLYDKIASVGMFEHVGLKNLPLYFGKIHSLLKSGGLVLNHGITTTDADSRWMGLGAGEFIDRYVFPEGELPHISLVLREMALAGFEATDIESLRRHYARTCGEWSRRLESNRAAAVATAGEKRTRIWQVYLAGCAYGFANGWMNIYQLLACKSANVEARPLPLTRDYMYPPARQDLQPDKAHPA